jgi:hypothetical protein
MRQSSLTVFQIQDAEYDPLTRTAALCSLVRALMGLSFGIVYIMRSTRFHQHAHRVPPGRGTSLSPTLPSTPTHTPVLQEAQRQKQPYSGTYGSSWHFRGSGDEGGTLRTRGTRPTYWYHVPGRPWPSCISCSLYAPLGIMERLGALRSDLRT